MREDGLTSVLIGGPEAGVITIVEYDARWPSRYEAERSRIGRALGSRAKIIEHIGSTAVPGLAAKPIVDILVAVDNAEDESTYVPALEKAGYVLRVREGRHRMFRTAAKDVHLHVWDAAEEIERHVRFRDWLRTNEADRRLYERTKRELSRKTWKDSNQYADAKDGVIAEITHRLQAFAR